ncbi:MAG TPA: TRAP transporter small permease subunit [Gammaproteobacteria bacterium]|nr:TRAP transporter small permease subunit [Gammaproteobacteria bacterium]
MTEEVLTRETLPLPAARTTAQNALVLAWASRIDASIGVLGRLAAWLTLLLVALVAGDVIARYVWHVGSVAEQQLEWHVLAVIAMLSASFTLQQDEHVRVDIFYRNYSPRARRILDTLVYLLVVVPTSAFIAVSSVHFVVQSYRLHEGSVTPGGLPDLFILKAFVPLGFALVSLEALALGVREWLGPVQQEKE